MPPKPQMIAKQDWRYVSGGGRVLRNAHEPSSEITSLAFASNGHGLVTRGADETLKVWQRLIVEAHACNSIVSVFLTHVWLMLATAASLSPPDSCKDN